jgi:hypothetical protein
LLRSNSRIGNPGLRLLVRQVMGGCVAPDRA